MKDINDLLCNISRKVLLVVFPHPDDESMATGGLVMAAKSQGWKVVVMCLTRGGAGKIHVHANGCSLKEVRENELGNACRILGADEVILEDFDDGKLREQSKWWIKRLSDVVIKIKPGLVVTYDPSGFYGHPDHIALSKEIYKNLTSNPSPNLGEGNQRGEVQRDMGSFRLLFVAVPQLFKNKLPLRGMGEVKDQMVEATHRLDVGWNWVRKWRAAEAHRSQGLGKLLKLPLWLFMALNHFEDYHLVSGKVKYKFKFIDYKI